ncbi:MAG: hypothetical protein ACI37N_03105, partial [Prevotella sp.]
MTKKTNDELFSDLGADAGITNATPAAYILTISAERVTSFSGFSLSLSIFIRIRNGGNAMSYEIDFIGVGSEAKQD